MNEVGKTEGGATVKVGGDLNAIKPVGLNPIAGIGGITGQTLEKVAGEAIKTNIAGGEFDSLKSLAGIQTELSNKGNQVVGVHPTNLPTLRSPISQSLKLN